MTENNSNTSNTNSSHSGWANKRFLPNDTDGLHGAYGTREERFCDNAPSGTDPSGMLSCELRGCIQSILANTELFKLKKARSLDSATVAFLDKIERNCTKIESLVDNYLNLYIDDMDSKTSAVRK